MAGDRSDGLAADLPSAGDSQDIVVAGGWATTAADLGRMCVVLGSSHNRTVASVEPAARSPLPWGRRGSGLRALQNRDEPTRGSLPDQDRPIVTGTEQEPAMRVDHSQTARMSDRCGLVGMCHSR